MKHLNRYRFQWCLLGRLPKRHQLSLRPNLLSGRDDASRPLSKWLSLQQRLHHGHSLYQRQLYRSLRFFRRVRCQRNLRNCFALPHMQVPGGYPRAQFALRGLRASRDGFVSHQLPQRQWLLIWVNVSRLAVSAGRLKTPKCQIIDSIRLWIISSIAQVWFILEHYYKWDFLSITITSSLHYRMFSAIWLIHSTH